MYCRIPSWLLYAWTNYQDGYVTYAEIMSLQVLSEVSLQELKTSSYNLHEK